MANQVTDLQPQAAQLVDQAHASAHAPSQASVKPPQKSAVGKLTLLLAVGGALAGGYYLGKRAENDHRDVMPADVKKVPQFDTSKILVTAEPVSKRSVQRTVEAVGTMHGFEEVTIAAKVEGRIRKVYRDVSDPAKPGEILVEIDPTDYELAVEKAAGDLQVELAKLGLSAMPTKEFDVSKVPSVVQSQVRMDNFRLRSERMNRLAANRTSSAEEQETAVSEFRAAQAEYAHQTLMAKSGLAMVRMKQAALAIAKQQLLDTQITAPTPTQVIPGSTNDVSYTIIDRAISEGTLVRPGTEVCRLVIQQTLKLKVPVPERHGPEIKLGQNVDVLTSSSAQAHPGKVTRLNPAVDPTTRTFEVEIQIPNPNGQLRSGGFAKALIKTRVDSDAQTVPLTSILNFAGINKLFLVEDNLAKEVQVTLGVQAADWVEIVHPTLPAGAQVVTTGHSMLASGTPVALRTTPTAATPKGLPDSHGAKAGEAGKSH